MRTTGRMRMATIFRKRRIRKKTLILKTNKTVQASRLRLFEYKKLNECLQIE